MIKKKMFFLPMLISVLAFPQEKEAYTFGKISQNENDLKVYDRDSTANAVFLYEYGKTTFQVTDRDIIIRTKYYGKVKIFNKEGFKHATVRIPVYNDKNTKQKVVDIKAITHNSGLKNVLVKKNVFTERVNENWSEVKFTMPNIREECIVEYEYVLETPSKFIFNFKGWEFQGEIPKIYSEFNALIPGNYVYNRRLNGYQGLIKNKVDIKKHCFKIPGYNGDSECEKLSYAMEHVPAFIEEDYMTSRKNYISSIKFELSEFKGFDGRNFKYTKRWKDVDREFRTEKSIGKQLKKIDYIKKRMPLDFMQGENNLNKAKSIYDYLKNHFAWNNKSRVFDEVNVKEAFDKRTGNSTEINIALINALTAVGFDAELMLISTRQNGLPTKAYPVMTDFNYAIVKLNIDNQSYLLDATNKEMPFGVQPFRVLNAYGRVMNFDDGSYWYNIEPRKGNLIRTSLKLKLNDEGDFEGMMHKSYGGYQAIEKRTEIGTLSNEDYLSSIEEKFGIDDNLVINSYENSNLNNIDKPLTELFDIKIESGFDNQLVILSPFIDDKIVTNPFQLIERSYPVDFGHSMSFQYNLRLSIPEDYKIKTLPEKVAFKLPNEGGSYVFDILQKNNEISMTSRYTIKRSFFVPEEYPYLKEFYNRIIRTQKSLITLEKIK